jgi:hypothetical protein
MSLALSTQNVHHDLRTKRLYIIATPTGSYVTGGDTVDLTAITTTLGQYDANVGYPGNIKNFEMISAPDGYSAKLVKGTTLKNWKLKVFQNAGFTPAGAIAIPVDTNVGATGPVYADTVANHLSTTGSATSITNAAFTGTAVAAAAQGELPASAYPAGVTSGTFVFMLEGPKGQI